MDNATAERPTRRSYTSPALEVFGPVQRLTMGSGGSSLDGNTTFTQRGGGNNGPNDPTPGNP